VEVSIVSSAVEGNLIKTLDICTYALCLIEKTGTFPGHYSSLS
jgi:hypothetical protein